MNPGQSGGKDDHPGDALKEKTPAHIDPTQGINRNIEEKVEQGDGNSRDYVMDHQGDTGEPRPEKLMRNKNAVVPLPLERYNQPSCPDKFAEMAEAMGADTRGLTKMQASDKWFDEIERLLDDLNIRTGHLNEQFGLQKRDC